MQLTRMNRTTDYSTFAEAAAADTTA